MPHERPEAYTTEPADNRESFEQYISILLSKNRAVIMAASEKTEQLLKRETVDPREFVDVLPEAEIAADIKMAEAKRAKFRPDKDDLLGKLAFSTEALIYQQVGISGWLSAEGIQTYVEKSADPDDLLRGTDIVVEFDMGEDSEPLAISIDLTIGSGSSIQDKVHLIKDRIDAGTLSEVRYHVAPDGSHRPLSKTINVVIGVSPEKAATLARLWTSDDKQDAVRLQEHPIQIGIARQIDLQLKSYEDYARASNKPDLAQRFAKARTVIQKIVREKEKVAPNDPTLAAEDALLAVRLALRAELEDKAKSDKPYDPRNLAQKYAPGHRVDFT